MTFIKMTLNQCVKQGLLLASITSLVTAADQPGIRHEPPANPYLADSPWPMSHRHPYNQASSPYAGPTDAGQAIPQFIESEPVPVTLAISGTYADGRRAIWGTTMKHVFKLDANSPDGMRYVAKLPRPQTKRDAISGAYSLVDKDGTYFVPCGPKIDAYRDAVPGQLESGIRPAHVFELPTSLRKTTDDSIVGINLTFDGRIVFVTRRGLVGSVSRKLDDLVCCRLDDGETEISNSMAVDEDGGIYVVTSKSMNRIQWAPQAAVRLSLAWTAPYQSTAVRSNGRLGTGSGTTPSLMGFGDQDKFVAIGDGQSVMNIVLFWRDEIPADWQGVPHRHRRLAAEVPVTFGDENTTQSTTEQSLTVRGYDVAVVSNSYGELSPFIKRFARRRLGNDIHNATIYRSHKPTVAPYGIEKFAWDPTERTLRSAWANPQLSCPNGIPAMSEATGLMYYIGQRDGHWTLEGIDWDTGQSVFHQKMTRHSRYNSFYAATEIGSDGSIMTGTFGGVLKFTTARTPSLLTSIQSL